MIQVSEPARNIAGSLSRCIKRWEKLTSEHRIIECIKGYQIVFLTPVVQESVPKDPSWSSIERKMIVDHIQELLTKGAISKCSTKPGQFLSRVFLVPKPNKSSRFILNLKKLNEFIKIEHFKLEDYKVATRLISPGCYMGKIDMKDAYYSISVEKNSRKYLRFRFAGILYEFNCLPFGLNTAPYVFTKITKPIVAHLRKAGFMSVIYLDDILLFGNTFSDCLENINTTAALLESLGFTINREKSCMTPSHTCQFLGFNYDSINMTLELPQDKRNRVQEQIEIYSRKKRCKIRDFAKFVGTLIACRPAIQYGMAHTKEFEREKQLALLQVDDNYEGFMRIKDSLQPDLLWWSKSILYRTYDIANKGFDMEIFSDASLTGWGISCNGQRANGHWNIEEKRHYINYLELLSAFFGLKCFANDMKNSKILLRIDNTTAISYINRMGGTKFAKLNKLAKDIWEWCEIRNIWIYASYISSRDNKEADHESRKLAKETEYELSHKAFQNITDALGTPEIDLFATRTNTKCEKFISWARDPEAVAVDAFTVNWKEFYFYAFPPFVMLPKVLQKTRTEGSTGIVVAPFWPAQPWYPLFLAMLESEPLILNPNKSLLRSPNRQMHPLWRKITLVVGKLSGSLS